MSTPADLAEAAKEHAEEAARLDPHALNQALAAEENTKGLRINDLSNQQRLIVETAMKLAAEDAASKTQASAAEFAATTVALKEKVAAERYRYVTSKQNYWTELARSTFEHYMKVVLTLIGAAAVVFAALPEYNIGSASIDDLLQLLFWIVVVLGIGAIIQIGFCSWRWRGFRKGEIGVAGTAGVWVPPIRKRSVLFELVYVLFILATFVIMHRGLTDLAEHVADKEAKIAEVQRVKIEQEKKRLDLEAARLEEEKQRREAEVNAQAQQLELLRKAIRVR